MVGGARPPARAQLPPIRNRAGAAGRGLAGFGSAAFGGPKMAAAAKGVEAGRAPGASSVAAPQGSLGREQILDFVVSHFLRTLDTGGCRLFTKCYSRLYKAQPEFTKCVYNQFISHLQNSVLEEIQALKQEGNLLVLFESLDKLEKGVKDKDTCAWRPSGIPEEDARGVVTPYLLKQRRFLQKALQEKQEGNGRLGAAVVAGRERIAELQEQIRKRKDEWQGIATDGRKMMETFDELP
ncbi:polyamine-modulated factor 1 [Candoia aspera]|uniref:polyamine-modulated factor 1 n=1 Tax=Candoia aspera TaxID=51853 RepID=UPI002FD85C93